MKLTDQPVTSFGGDNLRLGYAYYASRCEQESITPVSFRVWARAGADYDIEWVAAALEYETERITND